MAASITDECHRCKAYGHFQRDCPKQVQKNRPKKGKKPGNIKGGGGWSAQPKWCSYHITTTHSDAECQTEQELRENMQKELQMLAENLALLQSAAQASFSNPGSAHLGQSSPVASQAPTEPTSYGFLQRPRFFLG